MGCDRERAATLRYRDGATAKSVDLFGGEIAPREIVAECSRHSGNNHFKTSFTRTKST